MNTKNNTNQSKNSTNTYDDDDIPAVDLPKNSSQYENVEPLPESSRPRKDGPGGN